MRYEGVFLFNVDHRGGVQRSELFFRNPGIALHGVSSMYRVTFPDLHLLM